MNFKLPFLVKAYFLNVCIQAGNILIPILFIPIINKLIGLEKVGLVNYSQSYILYFTIFINYGFDFFGSRLIAQSESLLFKAKIVSQIVSTKVYFFIISIFLFLIIAFFNNTDNQLFTLHCLSFLINIGFIFFPNWYFIGTGQYKFVLKVSILSRILMMLTLVSVLYIYNNYLLVTLFASLAQITIGIVSFRYMKKDLNVRIHFVSFKECIPIIKQSSSLFITSTFINFYTSTTIVLIGFLTNDFMQVGVFSICYKIISSLNSVIITAFSQTIFSKISTQIKLNPANGVELINRILLPSIILSSILCITFLLVSKYLAFFFSYDNIQLAEQILSILAFVPLFIVINNQLALQGLINLNLDNAVLINTLIAGTFSIGLNIILIPMYGCIAAAYVINLTEILIIALSLYQLIKAGYKINFFNTFLINKLLYEIFKK